jgi:hypothetical protein
LGIVATVAKFLKAAMTKTTISDGNHTMNKFFVFCIGVVLMGGLSEETVAQLEEHPDPEVLQAELDTFRDGLFHAFNKEEYDLMLKDFCHKDIVTMWQDGTTAKGHAGVLAEFDKLSKFIDKMQVDPTTENRLILNNGNMIISSGKMNDKYELSRGVDVELHSSWTATLVKKGDKWVLTSFSASTNAFNNAVISLYLRQAKYVTGGIASILGVIVGIVAGMALSKKRRQQAPSE